MKITQNGDEFVVDCDQVELKLVLEVVGDTLQSKDLRFAGLPEIYLELQRALVAAGGLHQHGTVTGRYSASKLNYSCPPSGETCPLSGDEGGP